MNLNTRIKYVVFAVALVAVIAIPDEILFSNNHSLCLHYALLNIQCPLCGMTRAASELTRLHIASALMYNFNIIFLPVYVLFDLLFILSKRPVFSALRNLTLWCLAGGLLFIYAIRLGIAFHWLH